VGSSPIDFVKKVFKSNSLNFFMFYKEKLEVVSKHLSRDEINAVLGGDLFEALRYTTKRVKKRGRKLFYRSKILEALLDGSFNGIITDLEWGKARRLAGEGNLYAFSRQLKKNSNATFYEVSIAEDLQEYREVPAYQTFFALTLDGNLHMPNLLPS
jgi:hypothetical protein